LLNQIISNTKMVKLNEEEYDPYILIIQIRRLKQKMLTFFHNNILKKKQKILVKVVMIKMDQLQKIYKIDFSNQKKENFIHHEKKLFI